MNFETEIKAPKYQIKDIPNLINQVTSCPLKNAKVKIVYPLGNGSSKIMLIGEAPGAKEEAMGEPFLGASGKLLNNKLLPSVGLNRENIYLTNLVKCRPPNNRDPNEAEKLAWKPILLAEIIAYQPKLIVCLGRHSMGFFNPKLKIGQVHGKVQKVQIYKDLSVQFLPLYHPAVALYSPKKLPILIQDFQIIQKYLE